MATRTRRSFLAASGLGVAGAVTGFGTRYTLAAPETPNTGDVIVAVFLRGGADGLTMTPPYDYSSYQSLRPTLALPGPGGNGGALPLSSANGNAVFPTGIDGVVGLHPAFKPIHDTLWAQGRLAVIPATGMPRSESASRSHFSAEQYVARGSAARTVGGGWLGRMINAMNPASTISAANKSQRLNMLEGAERALSVPSLRNFGLDGFRNREQAKRALLAINGGTDSVATEGRNILSVVDQVQALDDSIRPGYPDTRVGRSFSEVSTLIKSDLGLQAAAIDFGGWDTHKNQGGVGDTNGRFWRLADELAQALRAFADDTNQLEEISVVVVTEFGRTINENGNRGTDHGRAGTHLAMGAGIRGGVFGLDFPDRIEDDPESGDLSVLTDYRLPLSEIVNNRAGVTDLGSVFPTYDQQGALGLTRA